MSIEPVLQTIDARRQRAVEDLSEFLRIPSVSTNPKHAPDLQRCARWLAQRLQSIGLQAQVHETGGHPAVLASNQHQSGRPTVLFYGHYDVQPPEPLEQWISGPFEPTVRNGAIYARGAADDKGQVWAHVEAVTAWQQHGGLPVNLIMLIEGEEEIGSENLQRFVREQRQKLRADIAVISDTNQFSRGVPAITYGLRGLVYCEVFVEGADHDTHSGLYGGTIPNPANVLCELLGSLHDPAGRVNLPGFYDSVWPLTPQERAEWAALPFDEKAFLRDLKLDRTCGEAGYTTLERRWARPTCDINGITSGYQGPGAKTIIPAKASAKVSMRLVPDQDPLQIGEIFEKTLRARCPAEVKLRVERHSHTGPVLVTRDGPAVRLAADALQIGFGAVPKLIREGGSIPVVGLLKSILGIETLLVGFGLTDDRVHSPNEKFDLDALYKGTRSAAALYERLSQLSTAEAGGSQM